MKPDNPVLDITRHDRHALPRHHHSEPYVSIVLAGGYLEAGDGGRVRARPGTVIAHEPYCAHLNMFEASQTVVLNLIGRAALPTIPTGLVADVDTIMRTAERDPQAASVMIAENVQPKTATLDDWPHLLADALIRDSHLSISDWADSIGLNPASASRGFRRCFGVSPKRFRREVRTRRALRAITSTQEPLAHIAADCGFSDQAHLSRACRELVGAPPGILRAKSVQ